MDEDRDEARASYAIEKCPDCHGAGVTEAEPCGCFMCFGIGTRWAYEARLIDGVIVHPDQLCPVCRGTGSDAPAWADMGACAGCHGGRTMAAFDLVGKEASARSDEP